MHRIFRALLSCFALSSAPLSFACPSGQYEVCTGFCYCVPNSGTVVDTGGAALNPLPDALNTVNGIIMGDVGKLNQGIGGLIIKGTCPSCDAFAKMTMSSNDKAFIERVVGRGFLVYLGTGSPYLVVADAATSIPTQYALTRDKPPIPVPPAPPNRGTMIYTATTQANCALVAEDKKSIVIGWSVNPVLMNSKDNNTYAYPNVDIAEGDTVAFTSDNSCPNVPQGQQLISSGKMTYQYSKIFPGGLPTTMKYFFIGQLQ